MLKPVFVWRDRPAPPSTLGYGAHIGRYPLAAVVGVDVRSWATGGANPWVRDYAVFFCNLFAQDTLCTDLRAIKPDAILVAIPDSSAEVAFRNPQRGAGWLTQFMAADYIGAVSQTTAQLYGALTGKPTVRIPLPIGTSDYFAAARRQTKGDFILATDHSINAPSIQQVAALARVQRGTDVPIVYVKARDDTKAYAQQVGLSVTWRDELVYQEYVTLAAQARLGVDLYAAQGTGRNEATLAYAGTPCIGSTMTDYYDGVVNTAPYHPLTAAHEALRLLADTNAYADARQRGIDYIEQYHSFAAVQAQWRHVEGAIMTKRLTKTELQALTNQQLADMNTAAALNEFWGREAIRANYFTSDRLRHYPAIADYSAALFRWLQDDRADTTPLAVLDVGCAGGQLLRALKDRYGDRIGTLAGIDYAKSGVEWARETTPEGEFAIADVTKRLPYDDDTFDITYCTQTLEHIPDWRSAIAEMLRVTRHHLVITVPDGAHDTYSAHVNRWSYEAFETALAVYGLREVTRLNTHMPCLVARLYKPYAA